MNPTRRSPTPGSPAARRVLRQLLVLPLALGSLALAAMATEAVAEARGRRLHPPPGALIQVGDHRLHLWCEGSGEPTVILEAGMDAASFQWGWVQPQVARSTRVCAYDRAGYAWSEAGRGSRTAAASADALNELLQRAGVRGPVVIAAHSYGGFVARSFAARHPEQLAGLILIDASHPAQFDARSCTPACLSLAWRRVADRFQRGAPVLARLGLLRFGLGDRFGLFEWARTLPPEDSRTIRALASSSAYWTAGEAEWNGFDQSAREAGALTSLGNKPLVVLTAGSTYTGPESRRFLPGGTDGRREAAAWMAMQRDLLRLSVASRQVVVPDASHVSIVTRREFASSVVEAIGQVVTAVRAGTPPGVPDVDRHG